MAISANSVLEVRTGGSDTNSGGFVTGASGTDYSQQDSPQLTPGIGGTSQVHTTTTQVVFTLYTPVAGDVGNLLNITGGGATAGLYEITAIDAGDKLWTLDRSCGTAGQDVAGAMGGAFATPGKAAAVATVSGNKIWVKDGTYTLTTSTPGSGGPAKFASQVSCEMEGYSATRGDKAATPTLNAGAQTGVKLFERQGLATGTYFSTIINMKADGNSGANNIGFFGVATSDGCESCLAINCTTGFSVIFLAIKCYAESCTTGFNISLCVWCTANLCGTGFANITFNRPAINCLAYACTVDGFAAEATALAVQFINCTADSNAGNGFNFGSLIGRAINCLATNHSGAGDTGFVTSGVSRVVLINCAGYNNTTNFSGTYLRNQSSIALTADPYVNQAGADFRPNATTGGGLSLREAAIGVYGQTIHSDVGALQGQRGGVRMVGPGGLAV